MKKNKYGAIKTTVDGITFDSKAEAQRYGELKQLEKAGKIKSLEMQPTCDLHVRECKIGTYSADFRYWNLNKGVWIVEDVKGGNATKTPLYRWKKKHVEAEYSITITEVQIKTRR